MGGANGFLRGGFDGRAFAHHDFGRGHDFRDGRFARGFGFGGLYDYGDCNSPYYYDYNSCYAYR
jgi:hypothetical protein